MKKKKLTMTIETIKLEPGTGKYYPIKYGKPVIVFNPDAIKKIIEQITEGQSDVATESVLKTDERKSLEGSTPSPSAKKRIVYAVTFKDLFGRIKESGKDLVKKIKDLDNG